ncbi:MAG: hypothetical protein OXU66_06310 [Gammaproteobacteria bacterium]|nr:hypothetical protein [Gammaproteobacteria bacterium]MDD9895154.1 hypothetical protein [Gammaproteobacteria bacterium]MDD9958539.1 hypothetical protein [Gammaproteobacteria bacterium]
MLKNKQQLSARTTEIKEVPLHLQLRAIFMRAIYARKLAFALDPQEQPFGIWIMLLSSLIDTGYALKQGIGFGADYSVRFQIKDFYTYLAGFSPHTDFSLLLVPFFRSINVR